MLARTEAYLRQINCLESAHQIAAWEARGIKHGFEGRGYELPAGVLSLGQIHSAKIVAVAGTGPLPQVEGDGLICMEAGRRIAVKTADCVPILIHHPRGVLAIHAGWRGLTLDILGEALRLLQEQRWDFKEVEVAIGPCISLDSFEVGPELLDAMRQGPLRLQAEEFALISSKGRADRWHLDLGILAVLRLARADFPPEHIHIMRTCTKKAAISWHSYRRDGSLAGRNWSWIEFS